MTALLLTCVLALCLAAGLAVSHAKAKRLAALNWEDLLSQLEPVQTIGIRTVAMEHIHPRKGQIDLEPNDLWEMMGCEDGLRKMRENADVLLALAAYAQRWNPVEGVIVAERMRRDALSLKRATKHVWWTVHFGVGRATGAFYLHEAAAAYYLMRQRLLALYETSHAGRHPVLAACV